MFPPNYQFGGKVVETGSGKSIGLTHTGCGAAIEVQVRCAEGHAVSTSEISAG